VKANGILLDDSDTELKPLVKRLMDFDISLVRCRKVSAALKQLKNPVAERWNLLVIDLVLPHEGLYTDEETQHGRLTGLKVIEDIRGGSKGFRVRRDVPILVLTNVGKDPVLTDFMKSNWPCAYIKKMPYAVDFAKRAWGLLKEWDDASPD
jgi:hypothetical protein